MRLLLVVLAATAVRVFTLWVGRAEFVGWLNHSYYYFVQTRGLLEQGALPYADMPLLFWIYALIARVFMAVGFVPDEAIVAATRLVMSVAPALIPLPIYWIVRGMNGEEPVGRSQWVLILLSGFLPLSLSHLPEFSQKNTFGLLLLAWLILSSQRLLRRTTRCDLLTAGLLVLAIALTHFGTLAATVLYGLALVLAYALVGRSLGNVVVPGLFFVLGAGLATGLVYVLDPQRFARIFVYATGSFRGSLVGGLFAPGGARSGLFASLAVVLVAYSVLGGLYVLYSRRSSGLPTSARAFWLAQILFCGLLVLPVLDESLMARLAVFMSVPAVVLLLHLEKYCIDRDWLRTAVVMAAAAGVALLSVGELVSSKIHNRGHRAVMVDVRELQSRGLFGPNDLVITRTGAEHVSNWFFGVKAGVITSLTLDDFGKYDDIYVLNPLDGSPDTKEIEGLQADSEKSRYRFMRANIPRPGSTEPLFRSDAIEVFELEVPPREWQFDNSGRWMAYSDVSGS